MNMYAEERQQEIGLLAKQHGRVSVSDLAERYDVTPETIRRDLDALAALGILSRVHGGAVPAEKVRLIEHAVPFREGSAAAEKRRIATRALAYLPRTATPNVILDAGTTVARLAELIPPGQVQNVVTNSLTSAAIASSRGVADVHLVGGRVRGLTQATVGASSIVELRRVKVDVAFLGTNGFSVDHGFSTPDPAEADVKRAMTGAARLVVVLADSSKFNSDYLVSFARIADADVLITDSALTEEATQALTDQGIEVVLA